MLISKERESVLIYVLQFQSSFQWTQDCLIPQVMLNRGRSRDKKYKFIENQKIKRNEIFTIMNLIAIVLKNGMRILGVSLPEKM